MKTLIVEDDLMSQCVLAKLLAERGHEVVSYDNAEQAILAYQREFYPLLFVDVDLPGMDGLQFCKWVRAQPNGDKVFIMVATSSGQPEDLGEVLAVGANDFLPKPYDVGALHVRLTIAEGQMQDYFERKDLEDALRDSQQDCNRLFKTAHEGAWMLDSQFRTEYVNPQMAAMLGYPAEELDERAVIDFLAEPAAREAEKLFAQQREGKEIKKEIHFRRKDGSDFFAFLSAAPVRGNSGQFQGAFWLVADLSERKHLETELADTRKKYEAQVRDLTAELNKTRKSLQTESAECKKLEQTLQQVRAESNAQLRAESAEHARTADELKSEIASRRKLEGQLIKAREELAARVQESTAELRQVKEALQVEVRRRRESEEGLRKTRRELESQVQEQKDAFGRSVKELKAEQAARKQADEALQKARAEMELRGKHHAEELARAEQALAAEATERKRVAEELLTTREDLARRVREHMAEMLKAGDELKVVLAERKQAEEAHEQRLERASAELTSEAAARRCAEESLRKTREDFETRIANLVAQLDRVQQERASGRSNLESQLRHTEKMVAIGHLAGDAAHDFNNLLGVLQGYSTILAKEKDLQPDAADAVKQIASAVDRATVVTRQLLTFSRKQGIRLQTTDLNELISNLGKRLRRATEENIALQFNYSPNLAPVEVDSGLIEQAVMNLVSNAREAMPQGGQLTIATKLTEIDAAHVQDYSEARPGRFVCLTVSDTGCGMDAATVARIFEPFFTTKLSATGTGLGLAIVYDIVIQHQGWIEVQSHSGQGSTFNIFLPPSSKAIELPLPEKKQAVCGGTETVLLVEDEPAVLAMAQGILQRLGYQVVPAGSGDEALSMWLQNAPRVDLLLTDMVMPGSLNGRQLAERLLQDQSGLKVVYTSGYSMELVGPNLATGKDFFFLQKPYHPDLLAQTVRNCLDGKLP